MPGTIPISRRVAIVMALGVQFSGIPCKQRCGALPTISEVFWSPRRTLCALEAWLRFPLCPSAHWPLLCLHLRERAHLSTRVCESHSVRALCLIYLSMTTSGFSLLSVSELHSFLWLKTVPLHTFTMFYHSFLDKHLGFFHFWAVVHWHEHLHVNMCFSHLVIFNLFGLPWWFRW